MKIWKNKFLKQMIIIITLIFVIFNGIAPSRVYANKATEGMGWDILEWIGGTFQWQYRAIPIVGAIVPAEDMSGNSVMRWRMGRRKSYNGISQVNSWSWRWSSCFDASMLIGRYADFGLILW